MASAEDQIRNLLHRYAEAVDGGQFEELSELFEHAVLRIRLGAGEPAGALPGSQMADAYRAGIILYEDGTPRTRHVITNLITEVDEAAGTATSRSYVTTLQQVPGHPIQIIATATYRDAFALIEGCWRFTERIIHHASANGWERDFIGDMSRHVRSA